MLYNFLISLVDQFSALNVFRYLTFRTGLSVMSSMIIVFLIGGPFIKFIQTHKITGPIREDGPIDHIIKKVGTPTMGGVLILVGILFLLNVIALIFEFLFIRKTGVEWMIFFGIVITSWIFACDFSVLSLTVNS